MCGIYGKNEKLYQNSLCSILKKADFRGLDYSEISIKDNYSLGHNRLAIIDLDARSNQPFEKMGMK